MYSDYSAAVAKEVF